MKPIFHFLQKNFIQVSYDALETTETVAYAKNSETGEVFVNHAGMELIRRKGFASGQVKSILRAMAAQSDVDFVVEDGQIFPTERIGGIKRQSVFQDLTYSIVIALKMNAAKGAEKVDMDRIKVNNTMSQSSVSEIFSINPNALTAGASGTIGIAQQLVEAHVGSKVVPVSVSAFDLAKFQGGIYVGDGAELHAQAVQNILTSFASRSVLVAVPSNPEMMMELAEALQASGQVKPGQIVMIDAKTPVDDINAIARRMGQEQLIVLTNERGFTGVDYQGVIDLHVLGADTLPDFLLAQVTGRTGRMNSGKAGERFDTTRYLYASQKGLAQRMTTATQMAGELNNVLEGRAKELFGRHQENADGLSNPERVELVAHYNAAVERSNATRFTIQNTLRGKLLIEPLKHLVGSIKAGTPAAMFLGTVYGDVINEITKEADLLASAQHRISGADAAEGITQSVLAEARSVFERIANQKGLPEVITNFAKEHLAQLNQIDYQSVQARSDLSYKSAVTAKDVVAVSKHLAKNLLSTAASYSPKTVAVIQKTAEAVRVMLNEMAPEGVEVAPGVAMGLAESMAHPNRLGVSLPLVEYGGSLIQGSDDPEDKAFYRAIQSLKGLNFEKLTPMDWLNRLTDTVFAEGIGKTGATRLFMLFQPGLLSLSDKEKNTAASKWIASRFGTYDDLKQIRTVRAAAQRSDNKLFRIQQSEENIKRYLDVEGNVVLTEAITEEGLRYTLAGHPTKDYYLDRETGKLLSTNEDIGYHTVAVAELVEQYNLAHPNLPISDRDSILVHVQYNAQENPVKSYTFAGDHRLMVQRFEQVTAGQLAASESAEEKRAATVILQKGYQPTQAVFRVVTEKPNGSTGRAFVVKEEGEFIADSPALTMIQHHFDKQMAEQGKPLSLVVLDFNRDAERKTGAGTFETYQVGAVGVHPEFLRNLDRELLTLGDVAVPQLGSRNLGESIAVGGLLHEFGHQQPHFTRYVTQPLKELFHKTANGTPEHKVIAKLYRLALAKEKQATRFDFQSAISEAVNVFLEIAQTQAVSPALRQLAAQQVSGLQQLGRNNAAETDIPFALNASEPIAERFRGNKNFTWNIAAHTWYWSYRSNVHGEKTLRKWAETWLEQDEKSADGEVLHDRAGNPLKAYPDVLRRPQRKQRVIDYLVMADQAFMGRKGTKKASTPEIIPIGERTLSREVSYAVAADMHETATVIPQFENLADTSAGQGAETAADGGLRALPKTVSPEILGTLQNLPSIQRLIIPGHPGIPFSMIPDGLKTPADQKLYASLATNLQTLSLQQLVGIDTKVLTNGRKDVAEFAIDEAIAGKGVMPNETSLYRTTEPAGVRRYAQSILPEERSVMAEVLVDDLIKNPANQFNVPKAELSTALNRLDAGTLGLLSRNLFRPDFAGRNLLELMSAAVEPSSSRQLTGEELTKLAVLFSRYRESVEARAGKGAELELPLKVLSEPEAVTLKNLLASIPLELTASQDVANFITEFNLWTIQSQVSVGL
ncbi:MAG: hypothetical protein ABH845_02320 [Candidatus Omnitrophota bacterium]